MHEGTAAKKMLLANKGDLHYKKYLKSIEEYCFFLMYEINSKNI